MTNLEVIKAMDIEQMAMFFRMAEYHILGWSYIELIDWLAKEDNISKHFTKERKDFFELHG